MEWFSLIDQVVTKTKDEPQETENYTAEDEIFEDFGKEEGVLSYLEKTGLVCVLKSLSLQLNILHARTNLCEIIEKTIIELRQSATFDFLYNTVRQETSRRKSDLRIERLNWENDKRIRQLHSKIRSNERIKMNDVNKKEEIIASLKDEIQNLIATNEFKLHFIDRWENARQGENLMKSENAEMELKWQLESLIESCNNEITVNDKICTFLSMQIVELENKLQDWTEKYEAEILRRSVKIKRLKEKANEQYFRLQEMKQLFNDRQKEMEDYLQFKVERKAEEEKHRFINESATKIQAWWRGTMVRRGLGAYKKRKKVARDKKKKDNK